MNTLFQGDNLAILQEMPDESVDLICTDPPFNTGKNWGAFNDKWEGGLKGYLKFMEPRAVEMRRVLKDTGSLYLHCDPTASHYLKVMLDGVFGIKQFRNEIVWKRYAGGHSTTKKQYPNRHDIIFFYSISDNNNFNKLYNPLSESTIKDTYRVKGTDGKLYNRHKGREHLCLDDRKGSLVGTLWVDKGMQLPRFTKERLGYPTQKPVKLYQRMIKASSNEGDTVLDPFCGSGTTLDAAQSLGRHWIGIDQSEEAINVTQRRMEAQHGMLLELEIIK